MLKYIDFCIEYVESRNYFDRKGIVDKDKYRAFLKNEKIYHKLEDINIESFGDFLKLAISVDRKVYKCIKKDVYYPNYNIAILKDSLAGGGIQLRLAFRNTPIASLFNRLLYTTIDNFGEESYIDLVEDQEDLEEFVVGRLVATYNEVMQARWMDYEEGRGELKDWSYYLTLPDDYFEESDGQ